MLKTPSILLLAFLIGFEAATFAEAADAANVEGTLKAWHPVTLSFKGPEASETDDEPNPFLDYRLQVRMARG